MARVTVPDDYPRGSVTVAGSADYHYGEADISTDTVERARNLQVREDEEGRYVGCPDYLTAEVREYLGVTDSGSATDETSETQPESGTCQTVKADGEVCGRDLPCAYHSEGDD